jgi:hypothetical protein
MARFPDGSDGVFKDGPNGPIRIGSIEESRCDVPRRLLRIWQQAEACVAGAHERPAPLPDDPAPPTEQPAPPVEQPAPEPRPDDQPRYENGRTWIEQYNWCQILHAQGVPCTVPPPP